MYFTPNKYKDEQNTLSGQINNVNTPLSAGNNPMAHVNNLLSQNAQLGQRTFSLPANYSPYNTSYPNWASGALSDMRMPKTDPIQSPPPTPPPVVQAQPKKVQSNAASHLASFLTNQMNQINQGYGDMRSTQNQFADKQKGHAGFVKDETLRQSGANEGLANQDYARVSGMWNDKFSAINDILTGQVAGLAGRQNQAESAISAMQEQGQAQADTRTNNYQNALQQRMQAMGRNPNQFYQDMITQSNQKAASDTITRQNENEIKQKFLQQEFKESENILNNIKQDIDYQKQVLESDAEKTFRKQVEAAKDMAKAGLVDYDDAMAQIESNLVGTLAQIESQAQESLTMQSEMIFQSIIASAQAAEALKES